MKLRNCIAGIITVLLSVLLMMSMSMVAFAEEKDPFTEGVDYIDENGITQHLDRPAIMLSTAAESASPIMVHSNCTEELSKVILQRKAPAVFSWGTAISKSDRTTEL